MLDSLPVGACQKILRFSEKSRFSISDVLWETNEASSHVYFPVEGSIALIAVNDKQADLSVGLIGREGMVGLPGMLGSHSSSLRAVVLGSGWGWRLPSKVFRQLLADDDLLKQVMDAYLAAVIDDLVMNALCQRFHGICPRLAYWLLLHQNQADNHDLKLTHELLGQLFGVRRSSITFCAGSLQQANLISYVRGNLHIQDRPGLEKVACDCYRHHCHIFTKLFSKIEALKYHFN